MKILMVCLGNICRSPMAEGILAKKTQTAGLNWFIDSAGTSGYHDGENPDLRAIAECHKRGIDISHQISRKVNKSDFEKFDLILAMDNSNYKDLLAICPPEYKSKIRKATEISESLQGSDVPDPYYDGRFAQVFEMLDQCFDEYLVTI